MFLFLPEDRSGVLPAAYFHAMARLGVEGLLLIEPQEFSVNLGCFDDLHAIDLGYCRSRGWPVMRREAGGGTVLLGPGQLFYQLVLRRGHPLAQGTIAQTLMRLSQPPIEAYRALGVSTHYQAITDIVTDAQRKISGQGAAEIDGHLCFIGGILMDFSPLDMAGVLRTESAAHRRALEQALGRHLTWLGRELQDTPSTDRVVYALRLAFSELFDSLEQRRLPAAVVAEARRLSDAFCAEQALQLDTPKRRTGIKIREGVSVQRYQGRLQGQETEAIVTVCDGHLEAVALPQVRADIGHTLRGCRQETHAVEAALAPLDLDRALVADLTALLCAIV